MKIVFLVLLWKLLVCLSLLFENLNYGLSAFFFVKYSWGIVWGFLNGNVFFIANILHIKSFTYECFDLNCSVLLIRKVSVQIKLFFFWLNNRNFTAFLIHSKTCIFDKLEPWGSLALVSIKIPGNSLKVSSGSIISVPNFQFVYHKNLCSCN